MIPINLQCINVTWKSPYLVILHTKHWGRLLKKLCRECGFYNTSRKGVALLPIHFSNHLFWVICAVLVLLILECHVGRQAPNTLTNLNELKSYFIRFIPKSFKKIHNFVQQPNYNGNFKQWEQEESEEHVFQELRILDSISLAVS